jgi:hypothetical protein
MMTAVTSFDAGGYRYLPSVFQYSGGVVAQPGFEIKRVRFRSLVPLADGFDLIEKLITSSGRPVTAFCACELRSPAPFTEDGFYNLNEVYVTRLRQWDLINGNENPVARSNVCPEIKAPTRPSFYAFSFTIASPETRPTFVVSGSGEAAEGLPGSYADRAVRRGETTPDAIQDKALFVLSEMESRLGLLGANWRDVTRTQIYTVHNIYPFFEDEIVRRGAARFGATWHYARPPLVGLEYEMDCAGVALETALTPS